MGGNYMEPGRYKIINRLGQIPIDLSGGDNKSLIAYPDHNGENQQWEISQPDGEQNQTIKSVSSGKYLTVEGRPENGQVLVVADYEVKWAIRHNGNDHAHWRVFWPGTGFNFDLKDGNPTPGTPIQLWDCTEGQNQQWIFNRV